MEIICIEKRTWESLKQYISLLTSEIETMKAQFLPKPAEAWLDSQDVCQVLKISKRTLQTYRVKGTIPCSMIGGKYYFRQTDIAELLRQGMSAPLASGKSFDELHRR